MYSGPQMVLVLFRARKVIMKDVITNTVILLEADDILDIMKLCHSNY